MENNTYNTEETEVIDSDLEETELDDTEEDYEEDYEVGLAKRKKRRNILLVIISFVLTLLIAFAGWNWFGPGKDDALVLEDSIKAKLGQLEDKSNAEIQEELNRIIEEGTMVVSVNANPVFIDGTSAGSLKIENSPMNHYGQKVVITLADSGKEVYNSGYIPVGYHIQDDKLSVDLDPGEYEAIATFTGYNEETHAKIGEVYAEIKISVLS